MNTATHTDFPHARPAPDLAAAGAGAARYDAQHCVHALFEEQARRSPDAVAARHKGAVVRYAELNARANRLARHLRAIGARPDTCVALCSERSIDMLVGLLAILKAGAAYVPLDPDYPPARLRAMLDDCEPVALLTGRSQRATFAEGGSDFAIVRLDLSDGSGPWCALADGDLAPVATPHDLAYVIYTSGSSGRPKGVMVSHANVVHQLNALDRHWQLGAADRVLQFASVSFDVSVQEIFGALLAGAGLVLRTDAWLTDTATFWQLCEAHGISVADLPVRFWHLLCVGAGSPPPALRVLSVGGELVEPATLALWFARGGPLPRLYIAYGPTETTVNATLAAPSADPASWRSIGHPLDGYTVRLVDADGAPSAPGAIGEMLIGGPGVARGYLNRPALSAQRFGADGYYRSGDLARWRADGSLAFCGRNDAQVKIRGFRIELGDIETPLARCAGVRACAVVAREDTPGQQRLVAYVVPAAGSVDVAALRAALLAVLPAHMVPHAFVRLAALPLTLNGKLDRQALPVPDADALPGRSYEAPHDGVERTIALVWQDLLGIAPIGRGDHFFALGGHSLLVVALVERLLALGLRCAARDVFEAPTVAGLARAVSAGAGAAVGDTIPNLVPAGCARIVPAMLPLVALQQTEIDMLCSAVAGGVANVQDIYPLAPLQEGMLFHHRMESGGDTYLLRSMLGFDSRAQLDDFLAAWQQVIDRHDILRSSFHWDGLAEPVQLVRRTARMPVHELRAGAPVTLAQLRADSDPAVLRLDLGVAPLMQAHVGATGPAGRWTLALVNHHLVADHVALEHIIEEVQLLLGGQAGRLAPPVPYRDFIARVRGQDRAAQEAFFRALLGDVDAPTAPFGVLDAHVGAHTPVAQLRGELAPALAQEVRDAARECGVPVAVLFSVAWAMVAGRCSGRDDVVFGTVLLGRMHGGAGGARALGMFINTLPLRVSLAAGGARAVLRASFERIVGLLAHEQAPLAMAQRCSGVAAGLPLFTSLLNFRHGVHAEDGAAQQAWKHIGELALEDERTNYPITVSIDDLGKGFCLHTQCIAGIDAEQVDTHLRSALATLAQALRADDQRPPSQLSILSAQQRVGLLAAAGGDAAPAGASVHALVERQARRTPHASAVIFDEATLSYAELNARANQLAHLLRARGAAPGARIAVCLERGMAMVVGVLAILKAGCAYVPLDPATPAERLAYMLGDSAPALLLTEAALAPRLPSSTPRLLLDAPRVLAQLAAMPRRDGTAQALAGELAYVIYTSGSTGRPKGVAMPHGALVNLLRWQAGVLAPVPGRTLQFAALGFDVAFQEIFSTLADGRTLVLIDEARRHDAPALARYLAAQRVDRLYLPFVALQGLAEAVAAAAIALPALRDIVTAGEQLRIAPALLRMLALARSPAAPCGPRLHNHYGPTESHVVTALTLDPAADGGAAAWPLLPPIGRPIDGARIYILDAALEPLPRGVAGEIYIGGAVLAHGYWNAPALSAERFVADPFGGPGARMYRSGDLGCWQADGSIAYLGRNDFQVKVRGFRIELGEIEARLAACDGVAEAVVVARTDTPGEPRLVAYLLARDGAALAAATLRAQLAGALAEHMIPSAFVTLAAYPLTPNGKLDRRALPAPGDDARALHTYSAPQGEVEQGVAAVWADVLQLAQAGRDDHFFELGGHSLLAVRVAARLQAAFGVALTLRDIFNAPRLADLADRVIDLQLAQYDAGALAALAAAAPPQPTQHRPPA